jgi:hypothetical protein
MSDPRRQVIPYWSTDPLEDDTGRQVLLVEAADEDGRTVYLVVVADAPEGRGGTKVEPTLVFPPAHEIISPEWP